ncbi:MAG: type II toxin-antitoxin system HicA family toxin [Dehalogenimonas sp.]
MNYPPHVWAQIKNITTDELIAALLKDGFTFDNKLRTERIYLHPDGRRTAIHYHIGSKTFPKGLLKRILETAGWSVDDMRRLKLVK